MTLVPASCMIDSSAWFNIDFSPLNVGRRAAAECVTVFATVFVTVLNLSARRYQIRLGVLRGARSVLRSLSASLCATAPHCAQRCSTENACFEQPSAFVCWQPVLPHWLHL